MSSFVNEAAWLPSANSPPVQVGPGPAPNPSENEVVIKVAYSAVNPVDWKLQDAPEAFFEYPFILGTDVAGTVVQLGSKVTQFETGQRVMGHCDGLLTKKTTNMGYQLYSTCNENLVSPVPDSLPLANAVVLPISVDTAATGLYVHLELPLPSLAPSPTGKRILIWGGASSVGSSAIQLAVASGLEVVTTASSANHEYVKSLGASHIFDYKDSGAVDRMTSLLRPGDYIFDCIASKETQKTCAEILEIIGGGKLPIVNYPAGTFPSTVTPSMIICLDPGFSAAHVGDAIWHKFMPSALAAGKFQAKPDPHLIHGGLSKVQEGIDLMRAGVSAKKIVIEISPE
ncbi:alcohol dehydrogenase [Penicillium longicatenatum]|uniref:alcohol dehydrogenase n=1 Tax=Penicillium longicatenatum TaxID=1561947 RepID=UPI002548D644|nr:alcohol dehydrogenase [Penicillium longicatenatum]KAJ5636216.1 alcohol dehydrogenase [Penicillium longicatenatum]